MNSWEIEIYNMKSDDEMATVQEALHAAGITDAGEEEVGMYLQYGKARSVFVGLGEVAEAVAVLNGLGYETDEDELDDDDTLIDAELLDVARAMEIVNSSAGKSQDLINEAKSIIEDFEKNQSIGDNEEETEITGFYFSESEYIAGEPQFVTEEDYDEQYTWHVEQFDDNAFDRDEFDDHWQWITADDFEKERVRDDMRNLVRFCGYPEITAFINAELEKHDTEE